MKEKKYIYIKANLKENNFICSGINLKYFVNLMHNVSNILLIKSDYIGNDTFSNFELIEGADQIRLFVQQNEFEHGDLCFVDYQCKELLTSIEKKKYQKCYIWHICLNHTILLFFRN